MDVLYSPSSLAVMDSLTHHFAFHAYEPPPIALILTLAAAAPMTLRQASDRVGLLMGAAIRPGLLTETAYSVTLAREFNMVGAEDAMNWWTIRRVPGAFDFSKGHEIVRFAQTHGMKVRGHCLVWDHNNPDWLEQGQFTPEQMSHLLQEHIMTVMKHYSGQVFAWDIVNEALDENGHFKDSPWYNQPGIGSAERGSS
jgi:endo-1,4-beta-xylanase